MAWIGAVLDLDRRGRMLLDVTCQREPGHLRQLNGPSAGPVFSSPRYGGWPAQPLELLAYVQLAPQEVDMLQFEPEHLARPEPAPSGDIRNGGVQPVDLRSERVNLVRWRYVVVPTRDLGKRTPRQGETAMTRSTTAAATSRGRS